MFLDDEEPPEVSVAGRCRLTAGPEAMLASWASAMACSKCSPAAVMMMWAFVAGAVDLEDASRESRASRFA